MSFEVSVRARILADLLERHRLLTEARAIRDQLRVLTQRRRDYATHVIAARHQAKVRQVIALAAGIRSRERKIGVKTLKL